MANDPTTHVIFRDSCLDCGGLHVEGLPGKLPEVEDDFNWAARDYDSIRMAMLEELAGRAPERTRWTPADLEVVIVEVLAAYLDGLSDALDRVAGEAYLETARRPETVFRLLEMIGFDSVDHAVNSGHIRDEGQDQTTLRQALLSFWGSNPWAMDLARRAGPPEIRTQRRLVSTTDYQDTLESHPLVKRAHAVSGWGGSWPLITAVVVLKDDDVLNDPISLPPVADAERISVELERFYRDWDLIVYPDSSNPDLSFRAVLWDYLENRTYREVLRDFVERQKMTGTEVILDDADPAGIFIAMTIVVDEDYFQSEIRQQVEAVLSNRPGGFFETGRLQFGQDLHASDIFETVLALEGVSDVLLTRFKRVGSRYPDMSAEGKITLDAHEIARCDNDPDPNLARYGYLRLRFQGGRRG